MINVQSSFLPLFFDESETDLWLALQRIEPEERSAFVKGILRQVLLGDSASYLHEDAKNSELCDEGISAELLEDEFESTESFSLETLFEVVVPEQDTEQGVEFDLGHVREEKSIRPMGFEYLMKHIIGTEEDQAVLEVLRGFPSEKSQL